MSKTRWGSSFYAGAAEAARREADEAAKFDFRGRAAQLAMAAHDIATLESINAELTRRAQKAEQERDEARRQVAALTEGLRLVSDALDRLNQIYRADADLGDPPMETPAWLQEAQHRAAALLTPTTTAPESAGDRIASLESRLAEMKQERDEARQRATTAEERVRELEAKKESIRASLIRLINDRAFRDVPLLWRVMLCGMLDKVGGGVHTPPPRRRKRAGSCRAKRCCCQWEPGDSLCLIYCIEACCAAGEKS